MQKQQITYTRYCDDMTFSGDFNPVLVKKKVQSFLMRLGFSLNPEKTHVCSQKNRQEVTGLVVNQKTADIKRITVAGNPTRMLLHQKNSV